MKKESLGEDELKTCQKELREAGKVEELRKAEPSHSTARTSLQGRPQSVRETRQNKECDSTSTRHYG